ncbi:tyrosine-type recombinase/integrase [Hydromonas duriensis]|uniref:Integrase n=1 Tax=Hydromonas duriensis TaxID=1527608 RepID=A0A4R6Y5X0_9BURK|nr:integrase arm-type DNA-binding domain-containing protein [Hydromonas duriensis]TDR30655.1 integrase [Hydromonas duriensis]
MLTDRTIKGFKPNPDKQFKKYDSDGLFMLITPAGGKLWRFRYLFNQKDNTIALGKYPEVSLLDARLKRDDCARLIAEGKDPADYKKSNFKINTSNANDVIAFENVALEWFEKNRTNWSEGYAFRTKRIILEDLASKLHKPINEIESPDVLRCLDSIEDRGTTETAIRARALCSRIFRYGVARGYCKSDPAAVLVGAIVPKPVVSMPAITEPKAVGRLLRNISKYDGFIVRHYLRFVAYVFLRPTEARLLEWTEIDWDKKMIEIPAEKMKMGLPLLVPMSDQVVALLTAMKAVTGRYKYVFASKVKANRSISDATALKALRLMGYKADEIVVHGFRSTASTNLYESRLWRGEVIERQLAHVERNKVVKAYNRALYIEERTEMMQWYADFLDDLMADRVRSIDSLESMRTRQTPPSIDTETDERAELARLTAKYHTTEAVQHQSVA